MLSYGSQCPKNIYQNSKLKIAIFSLKKNYSSQPGRGRSCSLDQLSHCCLPALYLLTPAHVSSSQAVLHFISRAAYNTITRSIFTAQKIFDSQLKPIIFRNFYIFFGFAPQPKSDFSEIKFKALKSTLKKTFRSFRFSRF